MLIITGCAAQDESVKENCQSDRAGAYGLFCPEVCGEGKPSSDTVICGRSVLP